VDFGTSGLTSIRYSGTELLERGSFLVNSVTFTEPDGTFTYGATRPGRTATPSPGAQTLDFDWGSVSVRYTVAGTRLNLDLGVTNRSRLPLTALSFDVLALRFPQTPPEFRGNIPILGTNVGSPTILPMSFPEGYLVLCNDDVLKPLLVGFPWALDPKERTVFPLRVNTGRESMYPDSLPKVERTIGPGATDHLRLSLRFGSDRAALAEETADLLASFGQSFPATLEWPDRRPIGSLIIGTAAAHYPRNPRGWFLDPKLDVSTPAGVALFRARLLRWADQSVTILKSMNAQGMITWDIEGEQFPHPVTYIGDPRLTDQLAPEMSEVVDDYFKRFTAAGLRVGVTIRPQSLVGVRPGGGYTQAIASDTARLLIDKIAYAKKRWGASLFYIDSNGDALNPLSADIIKQVAHTFPDVLLVPEHKNMLYYAYSAPYIEMRSGLSTPPLVRGIYKKSFSIINVADGQVALKTAQLTKAVSEGDVLLFRAWFSDVANRRVRDIYRSVSSVGDPQPPH
jgi:hypothetical protein